MGCCRIVTLTLGVLGKTLEHAHCDSDNAICSLPNAATLLLVVGFPLIVYGTYRMQYIPRSDFNELGPQSDKAPTMMSYPFTGDSELTNYCTQVSDTVAYPVSHCPLCSLLSRISLPTLLTALLLALYAVAIPAVSTSRTAAPRRTPPPTPLALLTTLGLPIAMIGMTCCATRMAWEM